MNEHNDPFGPPEELWPAPVVLPAGLTDGQIAQLISWSKKAAARAGGEDDRWRLIFGSQQYPDERWRLVCAAQLAEQSIRAAAHRMLDSQLSRQWGGWKRQASKAERLARYQRLTDAAAQAAGTFRQHFEARLAVAARVRQPAGGRAA